FRSSTKGSSTGMAPPGGKSLASREMGPPRLPFLVSLANGLSQSRAMGSGVGRSRGRSAMFLRTERLFLRPAWLEDAPGLARAMAHEPVVRMLARVPWPYREEHARSWIESQRDPHLPSLLVTLPDDGGRIVGVCGLHEEGGEVEIGYWISPGHWGRGYATEAVRGMLSLARLAGHHRIGSRHAADTPASGRVLRKAGFRAPGRARAVRGLGRGAGVDAPAYGLGRCGGDGPRGAPHDAPMKRAA